MKVRLYVFPTVQAARKMGAELGRLGYSVHFRVGADRQNNLLVYVKGIK